MQLTEQQIRYFETFGCLKFPGLFADDINAITDAFQQIYADVVAKDSSKAHDDKQRSQLGPDFVGQSAYLSSLIGDPRVGGIASSVLGDDCNFIGSDGTHYVGDTAWHSDRCDEGWGPDRRDQAWFPGRRGGKKHPSVKMALYLDPLTATPAASGSSRGATAQVTSSPNPCIKVRRPLPRGIVPKNTGELAAARCRRSPWRSSRATC